MFPVRETVQQTFGEVTQATVAVQCSMAASASVRMAPYGVAYREEAAVQKDKGGNDPSTVALLRVLEEA
jgi:hypothetical protein